MSLDLHWHDHVCLTTITPTRFAPLCSEVHLTEASVIDRFEAHVVAGFLPSLTLVDFDRALIGSHRAHDYRFLFRLSFLCIWVRMAFVVILYCTFNLHLSCSTFLALNTVRLDHTG